MPLMGEGWSTKMPKIIVNEVKDYLLRKEKEEALLKEQIRNQTISELKSLNHLWEKYKCDKVYLYGSFLDLTFDTHSDIDLAVEPELNFADQLKLYDEINKKIKREVEIRLLTELPFSEKIKREGIIIYERKDSNPQK